MKRKLFILLAVLITAVVVNIPASAAGRGDGPIIYVEGQDLFYDSIVTADPLPARGPFQELKMGGPSPDGLYTQFGPGDRGFVGGRWWMDVNGNGVMDASDRYFSCPLLGPGREEP